MISRKLKVALYVLGILVLCLSILFFALSFNRSYMGVDIRLQDESWKVISVDPSGLAKANGIEPGDVVTAVNGENPSGFAVTSDRLPITGINTLDVVDNDGAPIYVSITESPPVSTRVESVLFLFIGLAFWLTGVWILLKRIDSKAARQLYLLCLSVCVVCVGTIALGRDVIGSRHLQNITLTLIVPLFLYLFLIFPEPKRLKMGRRHISGMVFLPAFIIIVAYVLYGHQDEAYYTWFGILLSMYFVLGLLIGLVILVHSYFTATFGRPKQQTKIMMMGTLAGVLPMVLLSILPQTFGGSTWVAPQFTVLGTILFPVALAYSIAQHKLLDIDFYLSRALVYGIVTIGLIAVYILLTFGLSWITGSLTEIQHISVIIAVSCIAILSFPFVRAKIQDRIDHTFYKDRYDYRQSLRSIGATLSSGADLVTINNYIVSIISETLGLSGACLFLRDREGKLQLSHATGIYEGWEKVDELACQIEDLKETEKFPEKAPEHLGVEFVAPLMVGKRDIGFLCLGRKSSRVGFSVDDISFVLTFSTQAATAIENAILLEKAKEDSIRLRTMHGQLEEYVASLEKSRAQLRDLAARTESIREGERIRIAREIHDELGQQLTVLKMEMAWLSDRLPEKQQTLVGEITLMMGFIDNAITTVRRISYELRPGVLDDLGVGAAIEWQAREFQVRTRIKCNVEVDDVLVNQDVATTIFRIFQEALTNVARHSGATLVDIILKRESDNVELKVRDNGRGITQEQILEARSFGLLGMRERALSQGGELKISGLPGRGTMIDLIIPFIERKIFNDQNIGS